MKPLVILHLETRDSGGAHDYTYNIHRNMVAAGYHSYLCIAGGRVINPDGTESSIKWSRMSVKDRVKRAIHSRYMKWMKPYVNPQYSGVNLTERITMFNPQDLLDVLPEKPDYIFVHWVSLFANAKYVNELQRLTGAKVYYIMIDEAILSGACHYPWDCDGYQTGCRDCKMTDARVLKFFIRRNFLFKQRHLVEDKHVIYPTTFDLQRLKKSLLWKGAQTYRLIEAIDDTLFCPTDNKQELLKLFGIPEGKKVVFFGCSNLNDERKGMRTLISSLNMIKRDDVVFLAAGRDNLTDIKGNVIFTGHLDMAKLAEAYQVADVFVCPSLEDSGPQMINMGIMTGVPVVAFEMGVALDIVHTGETGYRAKFNDAADMAKGINYVLDMPTADYEKMSKRCRELALNTFSMAAQRDFFKQLLEQDK